MAKTRGFSSFSWIRTLLSGGSGGVKGNADMGYPRLFRLILVLSAGLIVFFGWYCVDRNNSYRVGEPSPRLYLSISSASFEDRTLTNEARQRAEDQVVSVRLQDEANTATVAKRIAALRDEGRLTFASPALLRLVESRQEEERQREIALAAEIAEQIFRNSLNEAEKTAAIWEALSPRNMSHGEKNVVYQILDEMLMPTVVEDKEMADSLRRELARAVPSIPRELPLRTVIVQKGDLVTEEIADILRQQGYPDSSVPWKHLSFVLIITFAWTLWLTWIGLKQEDPPTNKEWIYIALVLLIVWLVQRVSAMWSVDALPLLAAAGWLFLTLSPSFAFHVALGGSLIGYLLAFPNATGTIAVGFILCGVAAGGSFYFIRDAVSRIMIWRNVFALGLCLTFTASFVRWGFGLAVGWQQVGGYLIACTFWSSLVVAVLPLWEYVFDIISPLRLLELSHPSQPLLKRLQLEAPGTYHHTVTVGTLAEAVADKLGMNGLLIKTGAFYHDIGKLKRPHYFVENQSFRDNIHDRLAPQESAKILLGHVADGLKLADEYKLPQAIKNFIAEHHGKTCLTYFYQKAVTEDKEAGGDGSKVERADYCYPGPPPQRPETALLMLADSVEAAMKALKEPLAGRPDVEKIVGDVIDSKIVAGQLADVDFTLKELNAIKSAFVEVLMSMYHTREIKPIADPETPAGDGGAPQEETRTDASVVPERSAPERPPGFSRVKP